MASYKKHLVLNATAFCGSTDQRFQTILGGFVDRLIVHFHLSAQVDGSTKAISILRRNSRKKARQHSARRVAGMASEERGCAGKARRSLTFEESTKIMKRILRRIKMVSAAGEKRKTETLFVTGSSWKILLRRIRESVVGLTINVLRLAHSVYNFIYTILQCDVLS